jgi:hypothetical protein
MHVLEAPMSARPLLFLFALTGCDELAEALANACPEGQVLTFEGACVPNALSMDGFFMGDASPGALGDGYANFNPAQHGVVELLPRVDWRELGEAYVTPVKDQGQVGTCVTFATNAAVESAMVIQGDTSPLDLSEQFLVDCTPASINGYSILSMADDLVATGTVDEAAAPYTQTEDDSCRHPAPTYFPLEAYYGAGDDMLKAMLHFGPVVTRFDVMSDFFAYSGGVYRAAEGAYRVGGHAVTLVGYDDADGAWIVKNSWGSSWGEGGFFRMAYGESNLSYGVLYQMEDEGFDRGVALVSDPPEPPPAGHPPLDWTTIWSSDDGQVCGLEWSTVFVDDRHRFAKFDCEGRAVPVRFVWQGDGTWTVETEADGQVCPMVWHPNRVDHGVGGGEHLAMWDCGGGAGDRFTIDPVDGGWVLYADIHGYRCGLEIDGHLGGNPGTGPYERIAKFDCDATTDRFWAQ